MRVGVFRGEMRASVRLEDTYLVVEAIGRPQAARKHGAADLAVEFGIATGRHLEIHIWRADEIVVHKMPSFSGIAHADTEMLLC